MFEIKDIDYIHVCIKIKDLNRKDILNIYLYFLNIMSQPNTPDLNKSASYSLNNKGAPLIPMNRIRTIMKSAPEITNINQETLYSVCKATVCLFCFYFV